MKYERMFLTKDMVPDILTYIEGGTNKMSYYSFAMGVPDKILELKEAGFIVEKRGNGFYRRTYFGEK